MRKKVTGFSQKAFVFSSDKKFLTIRRTHTAPADPLSWDLPGGIVEFGESPHDAIKREIKEETGLSVKNLILFDIKTFINRKGEYWITALYTATAKPGKLSISWEHDLHKWVTKNEFVKLKANPRLRAIAQSLKS